MGSGGSSPSLYGNEVPGLLESGYEFTLFQVMNAQTIVAETITL